MPYAKYIKSVITNYDEKYIEIFFFKWQKHKVTKTKLKLKWKQKNIK